ncbi:hypothetical protein BJX61DRAFT_497658 [Aspergillus egyptiacus]|nr:hypothetical protein BJX61DRAFT_497658 [Aspergillus egyptiacus]
MVHVAAIRLTRLEMETVMYYGFWTLSIALLSIVYLRFKTSWAGIRSSFLHPALVHIYGPDPQMNSQAVYSWLCELRLHHGERNKACPRRQAKYRHISCKSLLPNHCRGEI